MTIAIFIQKLLLQHKENLMTHLLRELSHHSRVQIIRCKLDGILTIM